VGTFMPKLFAVLLFSISISCALTEVHAQAPDLDDRPKDLKPIVVAPETKSDSVITVPPSRSMTFNLRGTKHEASGDPVDLKTWIRKEIALNGLQLADLSPWHIVVTYDQFDEDGDNVHSGVYEEFWAGPKKFKRIYKSDNFNQTDYATEKGLYRRGDQQFPDRAQLQVRNEVIDPFSYAGTLEGFQGRSVARNFGGYNLQCVQLQKNSENVSDPTQYCFEPDGSTLRYTRGFGWFQSVYNQVVLFQGRNIAKEIDVTDGGKPFLKLRVQIIEPISHPGDEDFTPPADATGLLGDRVSGVNPTRIKITYPVWPNSLRGQHGTIIVETIIGKNGHVVSAHAVSGPPEGRAACEDAVKQWVFQPYLVLDKPVEVEAKFGCSYQ
jgi:hypothetical protein